MLNRTTPGKFIPPRRQGAMLRTFSESFELRVFAGDMIFPNFSWFPNYKDFWLGLTKDF
jgi:hypothetical protein